MKALMYRYTEGRNDVPVAVAYYGKIIGEIKPVYGGWRFFAASSRVQDGGTWPTVGECQNELKAFLSEGGKA